MKFNGRTVSFIPKDRLNIILKLPDGTQEHYTSNMPISSAHNLILGKLYIDVIGKT
jgi:hypothetical protein